MGSTFSTPRIKAVLSLQAAPELDGFPPGIRVFPEIFDQRCRLVFHRQGGEKLLQSEVAELETGPTLQRENQAAASHDLPKEGLGMLRLAVEGGQDFFDDLSTSGKAALRLSFSPVAARSWKKSARAWSTSRLWEAWYSFRRWWNWSRWSRSRVVDHS